MNCNWNRTVLATVCTGSTEGELLVNQRAPSVVEVLDRHIFQSDYPDKDAVLQEMAKTAYVDVMCQGCVFGDDSCGPEEKVSFAL
ncbi:hypothetical protein FJT64_014914 [Amphibalanus amphitrite]|uniref:Uncharacterized protein n=1 Tax=Amphibalanus amphitrite TaxID=1232801 RepID=A0A6A4X8V9_AMPAM|nr:hypothetical protein FJT64_014914 [Amphibalanus amphitrite]